MLLTDGPFTPIKSHFPKHLH